jgi:hypothetical protein
MPHGPVQLVLRREPRRDVLGAHAFLVVQLGESLVLIGGVHVAADDRANARKVGRAIERLIEQSTRRSN